MDEAWAEVPPEFWAVDRHMGRIIAAYRTHPFHGRPISQEIVGGWANLTQAQLSRIENGPPLKDLDRMAHWARLLHIPARLLWFKLPAQRPAMDVVEEGQHARVEPSERLAHALRHPAKVDLATIADLHEQVRSLAVRYDRAPSISLLAEAGECLGRTAFLRSHTDSNRVRRELYAVEVQSATLMGQLVWDASRRRDHVTARLYYRRAIEAARQLGDAAGTGHALLRMSHVALYGEEDPKAGLRLAQQTVRATGSTSQVLTGLAFLHAAEAHAMLGERRGCERALGVAEVQFGRIAVADEAGDLFSPTQFDRLAGSCYLFLGDHQRARSILERTARALRDRKKSLAIVLGNLTLALIRLGELEAAASTLYEAIDVVELTWGGGGLNIIFSAGRELSPWRDERTVQDVYDRLLGLMAGRWPAEGAR